MAKKYIIDAEPYQPAFPVICFDEVPYQMVSETQLPAAFYEAFPPDQARHLTRKLEFHYTPEHSSWLNMAEVEIAVLTEQCLDRRMGSQVIVANEIGAWESERNAARATIDWRFTIPNAMRAGVHNTPVHAR